MKLEEFSVGSAVSSYAWNFSWYSQSSDRVKESVFRSGDNGLRFTTRNLDHDRHGGKNCASERSRGGWWYHSCGAINLNGNYEGNVTPTLTGIYVFFIDTTTNDISATKAVKSVEMIIRTRVE